MAGVERLFDPMGQLDAIARGVRREFAFTAKNASEAIRWQRGAREAVRETIGFQSHPRVALKPKKIERRDRDRYELEEQSKTRDDTI